MSKDIEIKVEDVDTKRNHVDEYFNSIEVGQGNELFRIDEDNIDFKTELTDEELRLVNVLKMNDGFLHNRGLKPIFVNYYKHFMRLKVSKDRKGRAEYVDVNRKDTSENTIQKFGDLSNLMANRK